MTAGTADTVTREPVTVAVTLPADEVEHFVDRMRHQGYETRELTTGETP
jgi:hypothetical protein